jgi:hypothetical protein
LTILFFKARLSLILNESKTYQIYVDKGWFELGVKTIYKADPKFTVLVTKVTIKGLAGLKKVIDKHFPICKPCEDARS